MASYADQEDEEYQEVPDSEKTPVTIVTGFLGAGKTTLVNYILKEQNEWKICVVENEFGEVAIDNDLVRENVAAKEDIIIMDNGCVCCSVRGDLVRTFGMLVSRRKDFDAIIIETTGLADPSPIVFTVRFCSLWSLGGVFINLIYDVLLCCDFGGYLYIAYRSVCHLSRSLLSLFSLTATHCCKRTFASTP